MLEFRQSLINSTLHEFLKWLQYPLEVMLACVGWYAAYPLRLRNLEEMMSERGVSTDHTTMRRWVIKMMPVLAAVFLWHKRPVRSSWRLHEAYNEVSCHWECLCHAFDRACDTVDFLLTAQLPARPGCSLTLFGARHQTNHSTDA